MRLCIAILILMFFSQSAAAVVKTTGVVKEVTMFEECMVIRLEGHSEAFVYPVTNPSANFKFSIALAALNNKMNIEIGHWGTGHCQSLNDHESAKPPGVFRYIYYLKHE